MYSGLNLVFSSTYGRGNWFENSSNLFNEYSRGSYFNEDGRTKKEKKNGAFTQCKRRLSFWMTVTAVCFSQPRETPLAKRKENTKIHCLEM